MVQPSHTMQVAGGGGVAFFSTYNKDFLFKFSQLGKYVMGKKN